MEVPVELEGNTHDSTFPMSMGIDGARPDSSVFVIPGAARATRSIGGWAVGGLGMFAVVLGLLFVADRARSGFAENATQNAAQSAALVDNLPATTELPAPSTASQTVERYSSRSAPSSAKPSSLPSDVRGVDPSDLPETKGVDVSTLPLVPSAGAGRAPSSNIRTAH
jgi:hypothetical protein